MKKLLCIIALCTLLCACSDAEGKVDEQQSTTAKGNDNTDDGSDFVEERDFDIIGYETSEITLDLTTSGDMKLVSIINAEDTIETDYIWEFRVLEHNDNYAVIQYVINDRVPNALGQYSDGESWEYHISLIDVKANKVKKDIVIDSLIAESTRVKDVICCEIFEEDKTHLISYDLGLNVIADLEVKNDCFSAFSADGKRCYYTNEKSIYVYNSDSDEHTQIESDGEYLVDMIYNVITDDTGKDYIIFTGMAADYNKYDFIVEADTGRAVYVYVWDGNYFECNANTYIEFVADYYFMNHWIVSVSENEAYDYKWNGDDIYVAHNVLENQNLLFSYTNGNEMFLELFDYSAGSMLDATSFDISKIQSTNESITLDELHIATVYMHSENSLLIQMQDYSENIYFLEWSLDEAAAIESQFTVTSYALGNRPSVDISQFTNKLYRPEKLSEKFMPLREEADKLEEKYDIEIYIGEECGNTTEFYSIKPLLSYDKTEEALKVLDEQFSRYPEDFFKQFKCDEFDGLEIHLASHITGISDYSVSHAGGITSSNEGKVEVVINCMELNLNPVIHHELSHAIEARCSMDNDAYEKLSQEWSRLNPEDYMYMDQVFDYNEQFENSVKNEKYIYTTVVDAGNSDVSNTYFVDIYGTTNEYEDKARIFESVMTDQNFDIDFNAAPHLKEKLNFYAECIRLAFDTTGWEDVPWEIYMD